MKKSFLAQVKEQTVSEFQQRDFFKDVMRGLRWTLPIAIIVGMVLAVYHVH